MILVNGVIDFFYCPTTLVFSEPLCRQLQLQMQLDIPLLAAFPLPCRVLSPLSNRRRPSLPTQCPELGAAVQLGGALTGS